LKDVCPCWINTNNNHKYTNVYCPNFIYPFHVDWQKIYKSMLKPAFVFEGRDILDTPRHKEIGFEIKGIG